jgi:type I restriction enzyme R subunit
MVFNPGFTQFGRILHRRQERFGVIGVVAGDLRAQLHFAAALLNEFAHLLAGDFRQLFNPAVDQIRQLMQHRQALVNIAFRPGEW